jgi:hypothetical protein
MTQLLLQRVENYREVPATAFEIASNSCGFSLAF